MGSLTFKLHIQNQGFCFEVVLVGGKTGTRTHFLKVFLLLLVYKYLMAADMYNAEQLEEHCLNWLFIHYDQICETQVDLDRFFMSSKVARDRLCFFL